MAARALRLAAFTLSLTLSIGCGSAEVPPAEAQITAPPPPSPPRSAAVVALLDVSGSMRFPVSATIPTSRLDWAKKALLAFVADRRHGRTGLVVFAGRAYRLAPVTEDREFFTTTMGSVYVGMLEPPETAYDTGIALGVSALKEIEGPKTLVLFTDGDHGEHDGDGELHRAAARRAADLGISICVVQIGVGDETIPIQDGRDLFGNPAFVPILSRRDVELLRSFAAVSHGAYGAVAEESALGNAVGHTCAAVL